MKYISVVLLLGLSFLIGIAHGEDGGGNDDGAAANDDGNAAAAYYDDAAAVAAGDDYQQGDDYIKYWTEYAILPKRCIV